VAAWKLGTDDLPEEVVAQPLTLTLYVTAVEQDPRSGAAGLVLQLADRQLPVRHLSRDERQYVLAALRWAVHAVETGVPDEASLNVEEVGWPPAGHSLAGQQGGA